MVRCHIFDTEFVAFIDLLILAMTIKTVFLKVKIFQKKIKFVTVTISGGD